MTPSVSRLESERIRQAQAGDDQAFEDLVRHYEGPLYGYLMRRLGNHEDACDACQQVFVSAYRALPTFNPDRPFSPWLYTLAQRQAISVYRRRRPQPESAGEERCDTRDPAKALEQDETHSALWAWVSHTLSPTAFTVFYLRVEQNLSIQEIACTTGKRETHVKVILHRARHKLARALPDTTRESLLKLAAGRTHP